MLSAQHVLAALEAHRDALGQYHRRAGEHLRAYGEALRAAEAHAAEGLLAALRGIERPGARPTSERVAGCSFVRPFGQRWGNHSEARAWARDVLAGVPTLAVDGSQITPSGDYSIPVGAVQVGWFENPHEPDARYVKRLAFELVFPDDAEDGDGSDGDADVSAENEVNARRFELECRRLTEYMESHRGASPAPVCIFDGSLVVSFAASMRPALGIRYVQAVRQLLQASEENRVPVVGYVDGSRARDLAWMLHWLCPGTPRPLVGDGAILGALLRGWGDRSEALECARDDRLFRRLDPALDYYDRVHFLYLRTALEGAPARLDLPAWLLECGELERVVDVIRAECVVGTGYPYAVETADAVAVITAADRERFYRIFQEFVEALDVPLRYRRKAYSKRQRREG